MAPIILDGRHLFKISNSGAYSAEQRAEDTNYVLKQTVKTVDVPVLVEIVDTNGLPVIKLNGRHLLTVTSEDTQPGRTVQQQARTWVGILQTAIKQAQEERSSAYLRYAFFLSVACMLLTIAFSWTLSRICYSWLRPALPREVSDSQIFLQKTGFELGVKFILTFIRAVAWLACLIYITNLFPQTRELSRGVSDVLIFSLSSPMVPLGNKSYSFIQIIFLIGLFISLLIFSKNAKRLLRSRVLGLTGMSRGAQETVAQIAHYLLIFISTLVLLQIWGLDLSSLTLFASVLGVGIGLGLQGIAKEFVSGLVIIFERPIQVGDFVEVAGRVGTVERISVRSTEIRTVDQISIFVPNSRFLESEVVNWSYPSPRSRLKIPVRVAYGSNLSIVQQALIDAASEHPDILSEPVPQVFCQGFGHSSLRFNLLVWISEPRKQFKIKSDLYFRIDTILRDRQIEVPLPQYDLNLRTRSLPVEPSPQFQDSLTQLSQDLALWLQHKAQETQNQTPNGIEKSDRPEQ